MDSFIFIKLFGIFLLILGNAFFVGSEIALTSARRSRIHQLAEHGDSAAKIVKILHSEPERFYSVTQIGITLMSLALGAIGISTITTALNPLINFVVAPLSAIVPRPSAHYVAEISAQIMAFMFISALHIVGGELAPKVYAFHKPVRTSLAVARTINGLYRLLSSVIWLLNSASNSLLRFLGQKDLASPISGHLSISEDEIRSILVASESEGILEPEETAMIQAVFDLEEHSADEIMVPRTKIVSLHKDMTVKAFLEIFRQDRHHRYPVYDKDIDNIVGILSIKEVLNNISPEEMSQKIELPISEIMLSPYVVPETKSLRSLLADFKAYRQQMAIVIDEHGGTAGIVTLEDILEEVVGEYEDEFSSAPQFITTKGKEEKIIIDPSIYLEDLERMINLSFPVGDYKTLAGLIYTRLDRVPEVGDSVQLPGCKITVESMEMHRITQVGLERNVVEKVTSHSEPYTEGKTPKK
ncbi:MAG: hemolysin family protein [Pseudomonadota bacterium]